MKTKARKPFVEHLPASIRERILKTMFPFLVVRNFDGSISNTTLWMSIPNGWRWRFGMKFCRDLKKAIHESGDCGMHVTYIKEKFGRLDVFMNEYTEAVEKVLTDYQHLSYKVCIDCGADADGHTVNWILPMCMKCFDKLEDFRKKSLNFKNDIMGTRDLEVENDEYNYGHNVKKNSDREE